MNKVDTTTKRNDAKQRWLKLQTSERASVLTRARQCAAITIPSLLPPEGTESEADLPTPYQAIGAQGTNSLASKLLLALLPANQPFFRMSIDEIALQQLTDKPEEVQKNLAKIERVAQLEIETKAHRVPMFEATKALIVIGDALLNMTNEGKLKYFRLDHYCVKRSPTGEMIELVTKEKVHLEALPEEHREEILAQKSSKVSLDGTDADAEVELYTHVFLKSGVWYQYQQAEDFVLEDTRYTYKKDETIPWLALRWNAKPNSDYGRSHVEEYLGSLRSLEGITMAIVEAASISAKILFLLNPNGVTEEEDLANTENGGFAAGREEDVYVLKIDKLSDMRIANELKNELTQQLSYAFLMVTSVQRQGERVTAEEIRIMVGELEDGLGGVYAVLTQDLQLPLAQLVLNSLQKQKRLPKLPKEIKPMITTGLEALGRGHDLQKLRMFGSALKEILGEEAALNELKANNITMLVATAIGLDATSITKSEEDKAAEQEQAQQAQMMQGAAPGVAKEIAKGAVQQNGQN